MESVNKWCSLGERIYRGCKKDENGFLIKPTVEEMIALARQYIGRDVWEVHDLGDGARLSWCSEHNSPLKRKYKITGVVGVDLSGARWYVKKNEAYSCPLIQFVAESEFCDSGSPRICSGIRIASNEIFLSLEDVRRHFVRMYRYTADMYDREFNSILYKIMEVRDNFGSLVTWFRENGHDLGVKDVDMNRGFARLISELDKSIGSMRSLYNKAGEETNDERTGQDARAETDGE